MYSPQLGRFLSRDPLVAGQPDIFYDNNWFGDRLTAMRNLYGYADNNPVNYVDPSGLKCEVAIHCRNAYVFGIPVGTHCGLTVIDNGVKFQLDGIGGDKGVIVKRPNPTDGPIINDPDYGQHTGPFTTYPDSYCDCLKAHPATFNAANLPRDTLEGNSNWALNCMMTNCGIAPKNWGGAPTGYYVGPCKETITVTGPHPPSVTCCIKRHECPGGKGQQAAS
jgi:RHS repeat-associated protein